MVGSEPSNSNVRVELCGVAGQTLVDPPPYIPAVAVVICGNIEKYPVSRIDLQP